MPVEQLGDFQHIVVWSSTSAVVTLISGTLFG